MSEHKGQSGQGIWTCFQVVKIGTYAQGKRVQHTIERVSFPCHDLFVIVGMHHLFYVCHHALAFMSIIARIAVSSELKELRHVECEHLTDGIVHDLVVFPESLAQELVCAHSGGGIVNHSIYQYERGNVAPECISGVEPP